MTVSVDLWLLSRLPKRQLVERICVRRKLWHKVTEALRNGDVVTATQYKKYLEDQQREVEAKRLEDGRELTNAYFDHTKGSDFDRYFVKENMKALTQM